MQTVKALLLFSLSGFLLVFSLLWWALDHYEVSFLISCNLLYFKVYMSDMRIATPAFLLLICMEYSFPSSHFQSICVFGSEVCLLKTAYMWVLFLYPFSLSVSFSPFTFKVIIDICVPTAISWIVWGFIGLLSSLAFLDYISPFNVCCKARFGGTEFS